MLLEIDGCHKLRVWSVDELRAGLKSWCIKRIQHSVHNDNSGWCRLVTTFHLVTSALELMSLSFFFAGGKKRAMYGTDAGGSTRLDHPVDAYM